MIDDFATVWTYRDQVIDGFANTVALAGIGGAAALALAVPTTLMLVSPRPWARRTGAAYVDAMRCVPFLLFAYVLYFGLPSFGLRLSGWAAGVCALVIYHAAYFAEILRGVWKQLPRELFEAASAYGFSGWTMTRRLLLPSLLYRSIPLLGNQLVQVLKDTALLTVIAVAELTHEITAIQVTHFIPLAAYVTAVLLYWVLCVTIELAAGGLERMAQVRRG